jgi:hypothetical protein
MFGCKLKAHRDIKKNQNFQLKKISRHHLYYEMINTMKARFSRILKLKFVLCLDFWNFKHYTENFPATDYESSLESCRQCLDPILPKLSSHYLFIWRTFTKQYFKPSQIFYHFKSEYCVTRSHTLYALLLTIPSTSVFCWAVILCSEEGPYRHSTLTQERLSYC